MNIWLKKLEKGKVKTNSQESKKPVTRNHGLFCVHNLMAEGSKPYMNYNPKHQVKVDGKMSEQGADKAGLTLANAAKIAAILFGTSALISALGFAYKSIFG